MPETFFSQQQQGSKIKAEIVRAYFYSWAKVIIPVVKKIGKAKIGYLDFFCGQGRYDDGSPSTPLLVLETAIKNQEIGEMLVAIFNDRDKSNVECLQREIEALEGADKLKFKPQVNNTRVGDEIVTKMKSIQLIPSLIFIDPWGYKGLTLDLISATIKDWGCDCIFFFNYNRINAAINNPFMVENVNAIFGKEVADELRIKVKLLTPQNRETLVLSTFLGCLKNIRGDYSVKFKFYQDDGSKTSHFIILVTKNVLGLHLMKEIMAKHCKDKFGVPSYEFNPKRSEVYQSELFFEVYNPIFQLSNKLLESFKNKTLTTKEVYQNDHLDKPYLLSNYKSALLILEEKGLINVEPEASKRRKYQGKLTMGDDVRITFK